VKKTGIILFCVSLCLAVAFILPRIGISWPTVDDTVCFECHGGGNPFPDGEIHSNHIPGPGDDCTMCHEVAGDTPSTSKCIACHPLGNPGKCELVNHHEEDPDYNPAGQSCFVCHPDCEGGETTTTTTTISQAIIKGSRYNVFLVGPFKEGCTSTTMTFRSDNVLILQCLDGFGTYLSFGNFFMAVYWSNNYYKGYGLGLFLSGSAFDSYINCLGIAYFANNISPVVLTGYLLSTP